MAGIESPVAKNFNLDDSLDDFVFFDVEDDMSVDLSKSPIHGAVEKFGNGISLVFSALATIIEEQGWVVSIPVKGLATTAASALTGSLVAGVPGLAVGLITGAIIAYRTSPNRSKSPEPPSKKSTIRQVFNQMTLSQKKELIKEMLQCLNQPSVKLLIVQILKNGDVRNAAVSILTTFLVKKMGVYLTKPKNQPKSPY